ncbi:Succinate dehydrogenase/fumarate reductase, flavoprotein subunit [Rhizobium sp. RU35A]|uniref:FAD-binding protein n=1 Tax=Rhizobium straminoryzae TaxID=1387186 RepID=A0A549TH90_9HYPH|nr:MULTISPECIES: FAD-binding protein [Rhizobium]TRL42306.1 FAD-binding protein [Rhizobium straminoryzae]SIR35387.1 Succinate dehydrogenase/fumarate reductase, flavoprotein subunit [Rhizobium sp. RU35A]
MLNKIEKAETDVLVIGGGPAGCWAAWNAVSAGMSVILIDKGYVGTSGATAAGNTTTIYTKRGTAERAATVDQRLRLGQGFAEQAVVETVLDRTVENLDLLAHWGYPFPTYEDGRPYRGMLRGPDYLRFMRQKLIKARVKILDHCPAEELLLSDGVVAGAIARYRRGGEALAIHAGAVVIASGGCAFLSGALGTNNLTGDGYLMAAEAGATLSGMEFSAQYGISPAYSSVTKGVVYFWGTFTNEAGDVLGEAGDRQSAVAQELIKGSVYAVLDKAPPRLQEGFRRGQPNIFVPFDRLGIDPFTERFPITLRHEGTVRGTGGLKIDARAGTTVPGLFAAGDAATRQAMSGATTGGGGPNSSWAMATGSWAGEDAAAFVKALGPLWRSRTVHRVSAVAASDRGEANDTVADVTDIVKQQILPVDRGFFRTAETLTAASQSLNALWADETWRSRRNARVREAEALIATARWVTESALLRRESRGLQRRLDHPEQNSALRKAIDTGGTDHIWTSYVSLSPQRMSHAS